MRLCKSIMKKKIKLGADPKKTWKTEPEIERADLVTGFSLDARRDAGSERRRDYLHVPKLYPNCNFRPAGLM